MPPKLGNQDFHKEGPKDNQPTQRSTSKPAETEVSRYVPLSKGESDDIRKERIAERKARLEEKEKKLARWTAAELKMPKKRDTVNDSGVKIKTNFFKVMFDMDK
ncbi:hypothetical protein G7Y89_g3968 [Cudoniella acicularis]|uniref:Uncharacterized protein n=1 Tax=Cudoniella acicularis TaxID=354080 RepID=A0A8H4W547_9HELO|nr:hypothetical protein G7Y89_g3968 [Cudoniella acicularis]